MATPISIGAVARQSGLSLDTLRRWARQGRIRCWRAVNGRRLLDPEEVAALMRPVEDNAPLSPSHGAGRAPSGKRR